MTEETVAPGKPSRNDLTAEYVRSILDYNPETGEFRWKWRSDVPPNINGRCAGKIAAAYRKDGWSIGINKKTYRAHRVAWLYFYGEWPSNVIDHIDGNPLNNKIYNLRDCSQSQNLMNKGRQSRNKSGIKGVFFDADRNKWSANICAYGNKKFLGRFDSKEEAQSAYNAACVIFHGDFAKPE